MSFQVKTKQGVSASAVKKSFLHVRGVAFSRVNDLIFRKRLFQTSAKSRVKALSEIVQQLERPRGEREQDVNFLSAMRDHLLLFGTEEEVMARLEQECRFLPANQQPALHEQYAAALYLLQLTEQAPNVTDELMISTSDVLHRKLTDVYDVIEKVPSVDDAWLVCTVHNDSGGKVGRMFVAPNERIRDRVLEELHEAEAELKEKGDLRQGFLCYRALGYFDADPNLSSERYQKKIAELEKRIHNFERDLNVSEPEETPVVSSDPFEQQLLNNPKL